MRRPVEGLGPHLPGSLVLTPHLAVVVVSRVAEGHRVATRSALDAGAAAWTLATEGGELSVPQERGPDR